MHHYRSTFLGGLFITAFLAPPTLQAAEISAESTLTRGTLLTRSDISVTLAPGETEARVLQDYLGKHVTRTLYKGSKINERDVSDPVLIKRNATVKIHYSVNGIEITTTGRAMGNASKGESITVLNSSSRNRVEGIAVAPNFVAVTQ